MSTHKILLVEPPFYRLFKNTYALVRYPLSLGYLGSSVIERTKWDVMAYNADFAPSSDLFDVTYFQGEGSARYRRMLDDLSHPLWQDMRNVLTGYGPDAVGISIKSSTLGSALRVARIIRETSRDITIIAGGPYPSAVFSGAYCTSGKRGNHAGKDDNDTGAMLEDFDVVVTGEGENTVVDLLDAIEKRRDPGCVNGILYRTPSGFTATKTRNPIKNLDTLPFPFRHAAAILKDYENHPLSAFGNIFATRGCPYGCFYCGSGNIWGKKVRFRSPENVVAEMTGLIDAGIEHFHFDDDTFGVNGIYLKSLCEAIKAIRRNIGWSCEMHAGLVTDENIAHMKSAGCTMIQLGIESGNDDMLKKIRKGFSVEDALTACRLVKAHDIGLQVFFMGGFPWETEASLSDTARVIEDLNCDKIIYSIFTPYPGTEAFELCRRTGIIPGTYDPSLYHHQSPENCFCINLPRERFREVSAGIEEMVVKKNRAARVHSGKS